MKKVKYEQTQYEDGSGKELVMVDGYVEQIFKTDDQAREWISRWFEWKSEFVHDMGIDVIELAPDRIIWTAIGIVFVEVMTIEE